MSIAGVKTRTIPASSRPHQAGQLVDAREQVRTAIEMALRVGSRRQQNRLRALLAAAES